jgi:hypothetical protein
VRRGGPYWPTIRQVASPSEFAALGTDSKKMSVVPWFSADWAYDEVLVDGAEAILENPAFVDAAHTLFDAEVVRPQIVYTRQPSVPGTAIAKRVRKRERPSSN